MAAILSHVVTVTTAGTAVQGPDTGAGVFIVGGDPANTGYIYVGNDGAGDVALGNGHKLGAGQQVPIQVGNMNQVYFDASVNGEKATILVFEFFR